MPEAALITKSQPPRRPKASRTIFALILREMSTTYGRSALGYLWAVLEPVAGIILLTTLFSLAFKAPAIGTNFPLFFASGVLPFVLYMELSQKLAVALRFSKQLLFYPGVTFMDALIARLILNTMTQVMIMVLVFGTIIVAYDLDIILDPVALATGVGMAVALGTGVGTLNCYLLSVYPLWERAWAILNRPMFFISGILFTFDSIPRPYKDYLWWNPLIHVVGEIRQGIYATYDASYVSVIYVLLLSAGLTMVGLLLLRRYHRDLVNA